MSKLFDDEVQALLAEIDTTTKECNSVDCSGCQFNNRVAKILRKLLEHRF